MAVAAAASFCSAARRPGFAVDATQRAMVAEIVRLLDGMPLEIELAAARTVLDLARWGGTPASIDVVQALLDKSLAAAQVPPSPRVVVFASTVRWRISPATRRPAPPRCTQPWPAAASTSRRC